MKPHHPQGDIQNCLRCHVSPNPLPKEQVALCIQCHQLKDAHSSAPTPAHPVKFGAAVKECYLCHNPHHGPEATNHTINGTNIGFCAACHLSKDGLPGDAEVKDTCAQCHNLGLPADHPVPATGGAENCRQCHEKLR